MCINTPVCPIVNIFIMNDFTSIVKSVTMNEIIMFIFKRVSLP